MLLAAHRWRFVLSIVDQLPAQSRFAEAIAQDDEAAELMLAMPAPDGKPSMRVADWSPVVAELRVIAERLAVVAAGTWAGQKQPPKFPPLPRPEVAVDRVRKRQAHEKHRWLVSVLVKDSEGE